MRNIDAWISYNRLVTMKQLREVIPYSRSHIRNMVCEGKFPAPIKVESGRMFWLCREIEDWIRKNRQYVY